jgi:hypothetical protein
MSSFWVYSWPHVIKYWGCIKTKGVHCSFRNRWQWVRAPAKKTPPTPSRSGPAKKEWLSITKWLGLGLRGLVHTKMILQVKTKTYATLFSTPAFGLQKFVPASPRLTRLVDTGFIRQGKKTFLQKYANQLGCQMPKWMRMDPLKKSNACITDCGLLSLSGSANLTAPPRHVHPVTSILTSNKLFGTRGISTRSIWTNTNI